LDFTDFVLLPENPEVRVVIQLCFAANVGNLFVKIDVMGEQDHLPYYTLVIFDGTHNFLNESANDEQHVAI
jgi:hypothetical protein